MTYRLNLDQTLGCTLLLLLFGSSATAHNVQISGDVAGVWHVEPNHNPKAGEPAKAWVALTRKGGQILSLEQANCQMSVYSQPRKEGDLPVLQPAIQAINAEKYQSVPSADIIFPGPKRYQLELSCTPKTQAEFQSFQLKYDVIVAPSAAAPANNTETSPLPEKLTESEKTAVSITAQQGALSSSQSDAQWIIAAIALSMILGFGILGLRILKLTARK
ncbi:hypothetical protein [Chlorogloea sp. CCALA 695]|uniref:hypothetical protein n=1 Tax=Chlorogloea sp. CCALA 695 TaxID=2107693 RepID=UPI000D06EF5F|nr:hypothetical protein [Chlorogloea sp. CCALA 695]PSB30908.1 hypothetical protein C7B70_15190 [Chlorogloea sp. CCALA 695]